MPTQNFKVGEMLNKRSLFSKTWINFDGSYTNETHIGQIHFEDESGNLHNINTDLFDEADLNDYAGPIERNGKEDLKEAKERAKAAKKASKLNRDEFDFQGLHVPFAAKLPRNFKRGYAIGKGETKLKFKPIGASPTKGYVDEEKKNCIDYQDAWNDADVRLELTASGIKETIVLKTDRAPSSFSFEVIGPLNDDLTAEGLSLAPAWLQDANGEKRDVSQTIRREGEQTFIDLAADVEGLVYPIEIDPTVQIKPSTGAGGKDTYTSSGAPNNNYGSANSLYMGYDNTNNFFAYIYFPMPSLPANAVITSSTMGFEVDTAQSSFNAPFTVRRIIQDWAENTLTYNNAPTSDLADENKSIVNIAGTGFYQVDVTKIVDLWQKGNPFYGFMFLCAFMDQSLKSMLSVRNGGEPNLYITYNNTPTTPTVTAPNGGETWNSSHTVTWNPATDADGTALQYQIQLTTDGANWSDIVALTAAGVTSYLYDFINKAETSIAKIRVRAYDGTSYGPWDESNGVFSIVHNTAPNAPINLNPTSGVKDRAVVNRLSWVHSDPNGTDSQSKFDLQYRLQGTGTWTTVTQTTTSNFYDVAANALPLGVVEWQVRTYDQAGLSGPYSTVAAFSIANKQAQPTIISPADGSNVAIPNPVIQWSHPSQTDYHVKVLNAAGSITIWEEIKTSTNKAVTVGTNLTNQTSYKFQVAVKDAAGLWSDFGTVNITVSFTPPPLPLLSTTKDDLLGFITLVISNPAPTGTEPALNYNDVYRRENGGPWVQLAANVAPNGSFIDYQPKPFATIEYYVIAYGANGAFRESGITSQTVSIEQTQILLPSDPTKNATMRKGTKLNKRNKVESVTTKFAGREYPLTQFGTAKEKDFDYSYIISEYVDLEMIEYLVDVGETLLLRDNLGRKEYVTVDEVTIDEGPMYWGINLKPQKVQYVEGV